jgi:hypothetical protein
VVDEQVEEQLEEQIAELPTMAPLAPEPTPEPTPEPVALEPVVLEPAPVAIEPEPVVPEPVVEIEQLAPMAPPAVELVSEPVEIAPVLEPALPVVEPVAAAPEPVVEPEPVQAQAPAFEELFAPKRATEFRVVVRLKDGDGVEVGSFRDFGTAMEGAQEVIEQFSTATEGQWPFYAGRFVRPDLIVSVDVVEGDDED